MINSTYINNPCAIHSKICTRHTNITSKGDMCCSYMRNGGIIIFVVAMAAWLIFFRGFFGEVPPLWVTNDFIASLLGVATRTIMSTCEVVSSIA